MNDIILIISHPNDVNATLMMEVLKREYSVNSYYLDMSEFPISSQAVFNCDANEYFHYRGPKGNFDLRDVRSIWYRKPQPSVVPQINNESDSLFIQSECDHFIQGALWSHDCLWINDPMQQRRASRKIVQLDLAKRSGLHIPKTIITNIPDTATSFIESIQGRVIFKRTGTNPGPLTKTSFITPELLGHLDSIIFSPTTFQEYIDAIIDIRVICIGDKMWAVSIDSQYGKSPEDCRFDNTVKFEVYDLPKYMQESIRSLMHKLGLIYGAIDIRLGKDNIYYFLEVNPSGQFMYLELKTGIPLIKELASLLAKGLN